MRGFVGKIILIFIFIFLTLFLLSAKSSKRDEKSEGNYSSDQEVEDIVETLEEDFGKYRMLLVNLEKYSFTGIPNFDKSNSSESIIEKYKCKILINGAMYDKFENPLGLYYLNGFIRSDLNKSKIMNGIVSFTESSGFKIEPIEIFDPSKNYTFYMQTGPILIKNGVREVLQNNNNYARRIIFGRDSVNEFYAIAVFDKLNYGEGPNLSETADMIVSLKDRVSIEFEDVVNLDGGNASLFVTDNYSIKESAFSGSYLCFK